MGNRASSDEIDSESPANDGNGSRLRRRGRHVSSRGGDMDAASGDVEAHAPMETNPRDIRTESDMVDTEPSHDMSYWQMAKLGYQELVSAIIRPPRAEYDSEDLGPTTFKFMGKNFRRIDFELQNERGLLLQCSLWEPDGWRHAEQLPCIVYMHGNSSARVEALPQLSLALGLGVTLVAFDFAGSGLSEGDHVSLGFYERDDLKAVIDYLRMSGKIGAIALWGRSMGAATALLHGDRDPSIAALVLDSAFTDLAQLAEEMVEKGREAGLVVPGFVVKLVLRMIRGTVSKTAGFNIKDLCPIAHADRTYIPALFVAGKDDDFIRPHHSQQIHDAYAGDKNSIVVEGDHNSPRPRFLYDSVYIFLQNYLMVPTEWGLEGGNARIGEPPWSSDLPPSLGEGGFGDFLGWDEVEPMALGGAGHGELGMTQSRQAEFQEALFQMLSQEYPGGGQLGNTSPTHDVRPKRKKSVLSLEGSLSQVAGVLERSDSVVSLAEAGVKGAAKCTGKEKSEGMGGLEEGELQEYITPLRVVRPPMPVLAPCSQSDTSSSAEPGFDSVWCQGSTAAEMHAGLGVGTGTGAGNEAGSGIGIGRGRGAGVGSDASPPRPAHRPPIGQMESEIADYRGVELLLENLRTNEKAGLERTREAYAG
ncbi:unnamed protein product, partial [Choristocarpus tenellus]